MNGDCKMKPDELTNGTKPVLKKQSGERKEERKQQRMNDGNNDEFSAAKKTGRGHKGRVFTVWTYIYRLYFVGLSVHQ